MKWLIFIFSLYTVLLSGIPCDADDECCSDLIEQTVNHNEPDSQKDHKPVSPCSPFFACGAVHAIVIPESCNVKLEEILPLEQLHTRYISPQLPGFSSSIWQPPKQV